MKLTINQNRQRLVATLLCYVACWLGLALGAIWLWLGGLALQQNTTTNLIFNPALLLDGTIVIVASLFVALKNKIAVVAVTGYAIFMEIYLQMYQIQIGVGINFKPYFSIEILALLLANIGVFWWHKLDSGGSKTRNK